VSAVEWTLSILGAVVVLALGTALGDLLSEEIRGWLDRVPYALLALAARRVPADQRESLVADWIGELHQILTGAEARPVLRLVRGVRFAFGFLYTGPSIGRILLSVRRPRRIPAGETWVFVGDPAQTSPLHQRVAMARDARIRERARLAERRALAGTNTRNLLAGQRAAQSREPGDQRSPRTSGSPTDRDR
jgi:hypothetical protein